jgi:hypothetical protein
MDRGTARTDRHGWRWGCWYWDRSMTQIRAETRRRALLFSPFRLREVTFPNRVVIGPMQMYAPLPTAWPTIGIFSIWQSMRWVAPAP